MCGLIDDRDEVLVVLQQIIDRSGIADLVESPVADEQAADGLMLLSEGDEMEIDLVDERGNPVARLFVDVLYDPANRWRIGLRGWRLCDHIASL